MNRKIEFHFVGTRHASSVSAISPLQLRDASQRRPSAPFLVSVILAVLLLAACNTPRGVLPEDIPTQASLDSLATALPLTQNAPPAPFNRVQTGFERIDNNLPDLSGWRYIVQLDFDGTFAGTPRQTSASAQAEVSFNQLATARRIVFNTTGELIEDNGGTYEAVRLGPDSFLVSNNTCRAGATGDSVAAAAELRAGDLVGGVRQATPGGRKAVINGAEVYLYTFTEADLVLPTIRAADGGRVTLESGELWIAPANNAVVRYYLNLDVENAILLDLQLPVTGSIRMRYDLHDIGTEFNITVPFGC